MSPKYRGLAFHPAAPEFLLREYGVTFEGTERELPLYRERNGRLFWGGWGSFYTLCVDVPSRQVLREAEQVGRAHGVAEGCFSVPEAPFSTRHVDPLLSLPVGVEPQDRLDLYERNVKKHIRNTVAQSRIEYSVGILPQGWQMLHESVMGSRGRHGHHDRYFSTLMDVFGNDLITVAAHDNAALVGGLVCIRSGDYLHLLSIAVDETYRPMRVDSGLYDRAILFSIERGIRFVDFGLTDSRNESLIAHKKAFGAVPWQVVDRTFGTPWSRLHMFAKRAMSAASRRLRR